jgi:hypothetical protein
MRSRTSFSVLAGVMALVACRTETGKRCHSELARAQDVVNRVDSESADSVENSLRAVTPALRACEQAGMNGEAQQLRAAQRQLGAHLELLKERALEKSQSQIPAAELARLARHGDPGCPRGQAYKQRQTGKEIRCTGPQPVNMSWNQVKDYYSRRGYRIHEAPPALKAEYGSELYTFTYSASEANKPAKCVTIYPPPGMSWQEAASRMTSISPDRLKAGGTVATARGNVPLRVDEGENKLIVRIGHCQG